MKKRILLSSAFLLMLAACSNEENGQITKQSDKVTQVNDAELKETEEKIEKELEQKKRNVYAAHYSALSTLINDNGIVPENHELGFWINNEENGGVLYAELLDFNNDDIEELLIINSFSDTNYYILQVFSYINGESKVIHEEEFSEGRQADQTTISLVEDGEGNILIKHDEWGPVQTESIRSFEVSSLVDNESVLTRYFGNDEENSYMINDESIDAETFSKEVQKYKNERFIVNSNGQKFFEIDTSNPTQLVNNLLNQLKANQNSIADKPNEISHMNDSDLLAMKEMLTKAWYITNLNLENKVELIQNAYGYSLLEGIELGEEEDGSYVIIGENNLNEQLMRYFGTTVSHEQVDERPTESNEYGNVFYQNGKYYILDIGSGGWMELPIREVEKVVAIDKDSYYVEFKNYTFNYYEYDGDVQEVQHLPLVKWPDSARSFVKEGLFSHMPTGFSIMKKNNDGTFAVRYLSETNGLTDEEIKNLQN